MRNLRANKNIYKEREGETRRTPQSASHHVFQKSLTQIAKSFDAHTRSHTLTETDTDREGHRWCVHSYLARG